MSSPQIEVLVLPTGETRITTHGFVGPKCREATKALETALGTKLSETWTAEYHHAPIEKARSGERTDASR